ncbi:hypothetical protein BDN72DRAFT_775551 [Pluteus cervinus]|uniref:Uncharacterized protein n=1 Tax=Pluteus cervinus TaxID=181527 RepID=A0ACD3ADS1_9AGAR|nr:hypothetical protein BDN72DRAFT_775551 [Pluteus cervinus]
MSHDAGKADQIALHFYTKLFNIIYDARATAELPERSKTDKWFNLDIPDPDLFPRDVRDKYKTLSPSSLPPPFELQVLLCVPELVTNQVLVQLTPNSSRTRVDPSLRFILLESWKFVHSPRTPSEDDSTDIALPTIYKHAITLFRSLYSLLRLLPSWNLYKRIRRRTGGHNRNGNLSIKLRVRTGSEDDSNIPVLGFGESIHTSDRHARL